MPGDVNPQAFIAFCDGLEAAGQTEYARRGRVIARELQRALTAELDWKTRAFTLEQERDAWRDGTWRDLYGERYPS